LCNQELNQTFLRVAVSIFSSQELAASNLMGGVVARAYESRLRNIAADNCQLPAVKTLLNGQPN
jgi:hypothetical protein